MVYLAHNIYIMYDMLLCVVYILYTYGSLLVYIFSCFGVFFITCIIIIIKESP